MFNILFQDIFQDILNILKQVTFQRCLLNQILPKKSSNKWYSVSPFWLGQLPSNIFLHIFSTCNFNTLLFLDFMNTYTVQHASFPCLSLRWAEMIIIILLLGMVWFRKSPKMRQLFSVKYRKITLPLQLLIFLILPFSLRQLSHYSELLTVNERMTKTCLHHTGSHSDQECHGELDD